MQPSFAILVRKQPVGNAVSAAVRVLSVQAHSIRAFLHEQPPPETPDSSFVIYVILSFWFTSILVYKPSIRPIQAAPTVELPEMIVEDDRAGDRQVE